MIRSMRYLFVPAALVLSLGIASAQSKVAVINMQKAMLDTAELKKAAAEMEAKYKPRQAEIEKIQKELEGISQKLQTEGSKLTPQAEQDLNIQGQRKQRELQRMTEDLQAEVDGVRNEILQKGGQRLQQVVRKLSEEKGLDLVVDVTNAVYFKPAMDITKDATDAFDKAYPVK